MKTLGHVPENLQIENAKVVKFSVGFQPSHIAFATSNQSTPDIIRITRHARLKMTLQSKR